MITYLQVKFKMALWTDPVNANPNCYCACHYDETGKRWDNISDIPSDCCSGTKCDYIEIDGITCTLPYGDSLYDLVSENPPEVEDTTCTLPYGDSMYDLS
jgi:hypothetical protein